MELLVIILVLVAGVAWWIWNERKHEESGSHPLDGATKAPETWPIESTTKPDGIGHESIPVIPTLTTVLDVNKDGKVDLKDAVAAVEVVAKKTKTVAKKTKAKAVAVAEKTKKVTKNIKSQKSK
jgi:hypothetical protein